MPWLACLEAASKLVSFCAPAVPYHTGYTRALQHALHCIASMKSAACPAVCCQAFGGVKGAQAGLTNLARLHQVWQ